MSQVRQRLPHSSLSISPHLYLIDGKHRDARPYSFVKQGSFTDHQTRQGTLGGTSK